MNKPKLIDSTVGLELTDDELDYLSKGIRCDCGHLWALHNDYPHLICVIPDCKCGGLRNETHD